MRLFLGSLALLTGLLAVEAPAADPQLPRHWSDSRSGIAVRYPAGWHVSRTPWTPVTDPVQRFVLYSGGSLPNTRLAPSAHQVIAQLDEQIPPLPLDLKAFPPRPRHFRLGPLGRMEGFDGKRWDEIVFRERGRAFYLFVGVGSAAQAKETQQLLAALDSLVIRPR
jgi:hypothetical protein